MGHKCWFCMLCLISDQGSLKTVWNYGCVKQGSVDDCCTLVYWFWGCDYVPRGKIIFITIATASHCRVSSIWVTFTLWGHTWKCIIWMFLAVINEHHWKKAVSTPMLFITKKRKKLLGLETAAKSHGKLPRQGASCTWGEFCFSLVYRSQLYVL